MPFMRQTTANSRLRTARSRPALKWAYRSIGHRGRKRQPLHSRFRGHFQRGIRCPRCPLHGPNARRRFSDEFKAQTARLVLDEGKPVTAVARELDLVPSVVGTWVKHALADRTKGKT